MLFIPSFYSRLNAEINFSMAFLSFITFRPEKSDSLSSLISKKALNMDWSFRSGENEQNVSRAIS